MAELRTGPSGSIYDLGYRRYEGAREGRPHAVWALFFYSLRTIFGLGRSTMAKLFPMGLAVIALIPAFVQIAVAAISPEEFDVIEPQNYFGFAQIVVALFCAVVSPEVIGRDQRFRTLPLYFSRALSRVDYVSAKAAALAVALLAILAVPQVLLIVGQAVASDDLLGSLQDDLDLLPPIAASSLIIAGFMASLSLAIGSQTPRRAFATGAILAYFVIFTLIGGILTETISGDLGRLCVLISPVDLLDGAVHWLFDATPDPDSTLAKADLAGGYYTLAALAYTACALAFLYRRYLRMTV